MTKLLPNLWVCAITVADPGFPVGGRGPRRGAWTPEAVTFQKICMSKRKNLDPWGQAPGTPPLDPPMYHAIMSLLLVLITQVDCKKCNTIVQKHYAFPQVEAEMWIQLSCVLP